MTQDQPGQAQGTGYVVRGEVVPDDETDATQDEESGPMTRFKKVASALRGDRPDQAAGDSADAGDDPNLAGDEEAGDATRPVDVSAVRSPDAGSGDYRDDERDVDATVPDTVPDEAGMDEISALGPSATGPDTYATTAPADAVPAPGYGEADTRAGYGSPGGTEAGYGSQAGTTRGYGSQAGNTPGYGTEAGTAAGEDTRAGTGTGPLGPGDPGPEVTEAGVGPAGTGAGITEGSPAGKHAATADAGLRPGEATDRLGDFGDIAFGNLLPDAEQYTAQWQNIQFRFVDDPQASVTEAAEVVSQVTARLEAAIQERQRAIEERQRAIQERASALRGRWGEGSNADTETLRETLRMYRAFMDQLIGPMP